MSWMTARHPASPNAPKPRDPAQNSRIRTMHNPSMTSIPVLRSVRAAEPASSFIAAAESLGPLVAEHRTALACGPDLPPEIALALERAGLTRLWLPRDLGGAELPPVEYLQVIEAVARHDGAVGWCAAIGSTGTRIAGLLETKPARELFGDSGFASGSTAPTGGMVPDGNGWRVNGRWSWGSFIRYSKVTIATCVEHGGAAPRLTADGAPLLRVAVVPTAQVKILDTWNAGGLRATGSHDFEIENLWVPDERTIALAGFAAKPHHPGALYALPFVTTFALGIASVPLGIARASIDALVALSARKVPAGTQVPLREQPGVQGDVARAETLLRCARAFLFEAVGTLWDTAVSGEKPTMSQRALVRMAIWNAAQAGKAVVELMYSAAGGTATDERAPFAAQLRDVHAASQHLAFATRNMETAGRILLGMEPGTARF